MGPIFFFYLNLKVKRLFWQGPSKRRFEEVKFNVTESRGRRKYGFPKFSETLPMAKLERNDESNVAELLSKSCPKVVQK